jgi:hypothetical protein
VPSVKLAVNRIRFSPIKVKFLAIFYLPCRRMKKHIMASTTNTQFNRVAGANPITASKTRSGININTPITIPWLRYLIFNLSSSVCALDTPDSDKVLKILLIRLMIVKTTDLLNGINDNLRANSMPFTVMTGYIVKQGKNPCCRCCKFLIQ